jgi:hypothetical protein
MPRITQRSRKVVINRCMRCNSKCHTLFCDVCAPPLREPTQMAVRSDRRRNGTPMRIVDHIDLAVR